MAKKKDKNNTSASNPALSRVTDRFNRARDYRVTNQDPIWERSYNNWKGVLDTSLFPWRSKLFVPWSFTVVETIIPKVFARDPKWRALSEQPTIDEDEDPSMVVQDLLDYQWNKMGMRLKMYDYIKDSLMYGKGYMKVTWEYQRKNKTIMEPKEDKDGKITFEEKTKNELEYDDPKCEVVDPLDVYVDPDATCLDDATFIIHRKTVPLNVLKDNPNYDNVDKIEPDGSYADQYTDKLSRYTNNNTPTKDKHKNLVEILEYWEEDRLIVVANRGIVLRDTPNPFHHKRIPFVELDDYRDPHQYYGQSELSVIDPLQREINAIRNQRRDYDNLALNPVILAVPGTLRNPNSAVMAPGSVWPVSDLNSIDVLTLPQLQGSATDIEAQTAADIQRAVAIDEIGIGLLPEDPQRRSATEVVTAQNMAGKRFAMKIALLEEAVKKIGQIVFDLNQQFLDKERMIQIVGERGETEWVQLGPEDIRGQFLIRIEPGSMLPKDEISTRNEAVELLQYLTPIIQPVVQTNPQIIMPIVKMVLDTFQLNGKQEIMDELKEALVKASEVTEAQNAASTAQTDASTLTSLLGSQQVDIPTE